MKVLLVSEGKHEESGALESLVKRVVTRRVTSCEWDRANSRKVQIQPGKGDPLTKRALAWIQYAKKSGFDALVFVIDEDGYRERIDDLNAAQSETSVTATFPRALGVAIRSFDAWMLADEKALSSVLGMSIQTQQSPEDIKEPKTVCSDLLNQSTCGLWQREMYARIAEEADLARLVDRCPKGFGVFAKRLQGL